MSTPSTVTATLPPHRSYFGYSNRPTYQSNAALHAGHDPTLNSTARLAPTQRNSEYTDDYYPEVSLVPSRNVVKAKQPADNTSTSETTPGTHQSRRERQPDWHAFYKNGPPKEIIVIDDDSPPPPSQTGNDMPQYASLGGISNAGPSQHASKKRKTIYDAAPARHQPSHSHTNTPRYLGSGSDTISTDRTTSLHTTAPTSLGSHGSGGSGGAYVESGPVGQKRKRVTRQTAADEKKRKEIEDVGDAYSSYVPPPKPPIKAKDVYVQPVKDVSCP